MKHAGYDSEQEATQTFGCAPTDKDVLRIMKFLAALLAFRKELQMHNKGREFPEALATFFENTLTNAARTYSLESLDKFHDSLCKALQTVPPSKKSSKASEAPAVQASSVELEAKVGPLAECIRNEYMQALLDFIGMLLCLLGAGNSVGTCSRIYPVASCCTPKQRHS